jgi:hypothetical protein
MLRHSFPMNRLFSLLALCLLMGTALAQNPRRLKRADGFWGLHFDFHASTTDEYVGGRLTEARIDSLLLAARPDFIQIDCKGHPGVASYPTKVPRGTAVASFTQDPLRLWRKATARRGVALVMHYSGIWDEQAVRKYPHWARVNADGSRSDRHVSLFSAYVDSLLLPQLTELSQVYGVDGVWVDGDCWAAQPDYSPAAIAAFYRETGLDAPRQPGEANWYAWQEFHRRAFRAYVGRYVDGIHRVNPAFQITSNWSYSSMMPEAVDTKVDFLSGDVASANGVLSAAFQARCLAPQGRPWDLMAWGFSTDFKGLHVAKSTVQIQQEAAQVLAMGGAFQVYFPQNRDASVRARYLPTLSAVAQFCRDRQLLHRARPLPQVGLLYSREAIHRVARNLYNPSDAEIGPFKGILTALLDAGQSVEVLSEHHLADSTALNRYPVLAVPEWAYLDPGLRERLTRYAFGGGTLVLMGTKAVRHLEPYLGVTLGETRPVGTFYLNADLTNRTERLTGLTAARTDFTPVGSTATLGTLFGSEDSRSQGGQAVSMARVGLGRVVGVYVDLGESYLHRRSHDVRDFLGALFQQLYEPVATVSGSRAVHLVTAEKDGKVLINLLNVSGPHDARNTMAYDEVPPLRDLRVTIRLARAPQQIRLWPGNQHVPFRFSNGQTTITLPRLDLHSVLVVE